MKSLLEGADDYRRLFDVTPFPHFVYDLETLTILEVNQAALYTYGYTHDEFLSLSLDALMNRDALVSCPTAAQDTPLEKRRGQHRKKNGECIDVEINGYPVEFGGRPARLEIVVDVTEQVKREQRLQAQIHRYQEMAEHTTDAIYVRDLQGRLTWMNATGRRFLGYTEEEIPNLDVSRLLRPKDLHHLEKMIKRRLSGEEAKSLYEVDVVTKNGRILPVEISSSLIYEDGKPVGVLGIARSLTERKQLEEQLRQAQKMEAVGRLAGGIAHDFNNRLTAIQGFTDLLLKRTDKHEQPYYYLEQIKIASERAAELTRQLLTFSRKQALHPKTINLNEVVSHWANLVRVLLGENIAVHLILGSDIGPVKVDPGQMEHVIMNLALNASDAMPHGGDFTIETTDLEISELQAQFNATIPPGQYVRLLIKDNGCGMTETTKEHLFEPFFTTKEPGKGTGLGLFTAYGIIRQSGGYIEVRSAPQEGTTFMIYLPMVDLEKELPPASLTVAPLAVGRERILVVEDEPTVRTLVCEVLAEAGYEVLNAPHALDALGLLAQQTAPIDLLLTDIRMPGMDGCDLAEKVRRFSPETRILFMSAYTDDPRVMNAVLGADLAFLQKPFTPDALTQAVRKVLDASTTIAATA